MAKIFKMIAQRLGLGLITLLVVSLIIFLGVELLPGDLAEAILGQAATEETVVSNVLSGRIVSGQWPYQATGRLLILLRPIRQ